MILDSSGKDIMKENVITTKSGMPYPFAQSSVDSVEVSLPTTLHVVQKNGERISFDTERIRTAVKWACRGYEAADVELITRETMRCVFDGITEAEICMALILAASTFIERDPEYGYVAARLLFRQLYQEVTGFSVNESDSDREYIRSFITGIQQGIELEILDPRMKYFDLEYLASHLEPSRDEFFDFMGLRTLYERYFTKHENKRLELPQHFWMRVAMGLCYNEPNKNERAVEFYNLMSQMLYVPGTPTLLHSGQTYPQLSSCFLTTFQDDLHDIFKGLGDNAQLSKWSGGVANDWTNVRATGSFIKSIKTESQGLIPFLKINSDVTASINRSGKRRAATVVYLECWHMDYEDFLDLRKNTGDERRRAHDINTASWIPDLFMKRVRDNQKWTFFSPHETPELHHIYGAEFEKRYCEYEQKAARGEMRLTKTIEARDLWRKMLSRLFETGHPWVTFKDPSNIRSPQDHVGVVHSSNLCTEITLNTSADEIAVCNLGSIELGRHIKNGALDETLLASTLRTAVRMLDNVIDINFYPVKEAQNSNMRHRPIGLGVMGFQDALYNLDVPFDAERVEQIADEYAEKISYYAILASSELAKERGTYQSYKGSKWDRGIFPLDTLDLLEKERGEKIIVSRDASLDWAPVREHVKQYGMRNSNTMAIAPTATISTIAGCYPCIEPIYKNLYVKANMSGEFTVVNKYLVQDLKAAGLWDQEMLDDLKYFDGNVQKIERIPQALKHKYKEAFEIDPLHMIRISARRMKWIDQSQSHNVFMYGVSGKQLSDIYMTAWQYGMKTLYYLRTLGASQIEKSTLDAKRYGFTQKRQYQQAEESGKAVQEKVVEQAIQVDPAAMPVQDEMLGSVRSCSISSDPSCESCQ